MRKRGPKERMAVKFEAEFMPSSVAQSSWISSDYAVEYAHFTNVEEEESDECIPEAARDTKNTTSASIMQRGLLKPDAGNHEKIEKQNEAEPKKSK